MVSIEMSPGIPKIEFRNLQRNEIPRVLELCAKEGRHMGTESELQTWFEIDQEGFFVAVTEDGKIVGSCVGIRLSPFHGNVGMFVVEKEYRGFGIGTSIFDLAINHLGEQRNKGLSAIPKLFHIYVDRARFNKVASYDILLFKLDGKRLLANLASFLKSGPTKHDAFAGSEMRNFENVNRLGVDDKSDDRSDDSLSESSSSSESGSEDLNSIIENEELDSDSFNHRKSVTANESAGSTDMNNNQQQSPNNFLKDITHEDNLAEPESAWIRKKKPDLGLSKFHTFNQLIYYSTPKPRHSHLNSFSNYSTNKFFQNEIILKPSSPSISLPSLLNSDSSSIFDRNSFNNHHKSSTGNSHQNTKNRLHIIPYSQIWLHKLIDFDQRLNGYDRSKIVTLSVDEAKSKTKLAIMNDEIVGYAIVKYSLQDTYLIAPLYCDSQTIAKDLIKEFVRSMSIEQLAKGLVLKLPSCNHSAIELMESLGFEKQANLVTRCFTDYVHCSPTSRIFAMQSTIFSSISMVSRKCEPCFMTQTLEALLKKRQNSNRTK